MGAVKVGESVAQFVGRYCGSEFVRSSLPCLWPHGVLSHSQHTMQVCIRICTYIYVYMFACIFGFVRSWLPRVARCHRLFAVYDKCTYAYEYVYMYIYIHMYMYVYTCMYVHVHIFVHGDLGMYMCV